MEMITHQEHPNVYATPSTGVLNLPTHLGFQSFKSVEHPYALLHLRSGWALVGVPDPTNLQNIIEYRWAVSGDIRAIPLQHARYDMSGSRFSAPRQFSSQNFPQDDR